MNDTTRKTRHLLLAAGICFCGLLFMLPAAAHSQEPAPTVDKADAGFVPMFNGKDLSGWQTTGTWVYEPDGVLTLRPTSRRRRLIPDHESFLWTRASYDNFVLDLEFKVSANGSSGVFMRSTTRRSYLQTQIRDSYGNRGSLGDSTTGAVVGVAAPSKNMSKPAGEWNHMIITCDRNRMQVQLNGEEVINFDLNTSPSARAVRSGRIGFEIASSPVSFRNVRIKQLKQE